jgi:hypothetical protein
MITTDEFTLSQTHQDDSSPKSVREHLSESKYNRRLEIAATQTNASASRKEVRLRGLKEFETQDR